MLLINCAFSMHRFKYPTIPNDSIAVNPLSNYSVVITKNTTVIVSNVSKTNIFYCSTRIYTIYKNLALAKFLLLATHWLFVSKTNTFYPDRVFSICFANNNIYSIPYRHCLFWLWNVFLALNCFDHALLSTPIVN